MYVMPDPDSNIYTFRNFRLDAAERTLFDGKNAIQLAPKAFDTLLMLVDNCGKVLSKEKMLTEIWEDSFVEENNLAQNISILRRVLGETADVRFIETVPKLGYRFKVPVTVESAESGEIHISASACLPETHYAQNGEVNIAYQVLGEGERDIVFVMGWVSHVEYFWKHPLFASFLNRLASFSRLILFDKRGTGLSDRIPLSQLPTLEQRMEDVHAVMDAVDSQRAVLIGVSEGGPMCSLFAATYPERTEALVMIGTYAKRIWDRDYPWAPTAEQLAAFLELMQRDWGKPVGLEERAPSMANDEEFRDWWATYLRMGASPGAAVALTKMNADIDVRNILPSIRVPSMVIHRTGDLCLNVEEGRYVASRIPDCKFVELDGIDHLPFVGNQEEILDEIESFLAGVAPSAQQDRVLATVMNVRIDNAGPQVFQRSRADIRQQLEVFNGKEVPYDNGGILAAFDGPARAIRCAAAICEALSGIDVHTGLHTGECDVVKGTYGGFAVDLARKIAGASANGNILVSRTVKDLVAGSGIAFEDFGIRSFDGVEGEWRLFSVVK